MSKPTGYIVTLSAADSSKGTRQYIAAERVAGVGRITSTDSRGDAGVYSASEAELLRSAIVRTSGGVSWRSVPADAALDSDAS